MTNNREFKRSISSILTAENKIDLNKALCCHFSYLADTPGFERVLVAIMAQAERVSGKDGDLLVHFPGENRILIASPPADQSVYEKWPQSFQKCVAHHEHLSFPEKGWALHLGDVGLFESEYLEEDDSDLLEFTTRQEVLCPITDYSDWWLYHPGYKNPIGEASIALFSHEGEDLYPPEKYSVSALFLKRMAEILDLDIEIPEILEPGVDLKEFRNFWDTLGSDWQTALKKCNDIEKDDLGDQELARLINSSSFSCYDSERGLKDLSPLSRFRELTQINISRQKEIVSLTPLTGLEKLKSLSIRGAKVSSIKPLSGLNSLKQLAFENNPVSDLGPLKGMDRLRELNISKTRVIDLSPINNLLKLKTINLTGTSVSNLEPLTRMENLKNIDLSDTPVTDLGPLKKSNKLDKVSFDRTDIRDLSPLYHIRGIDALHCEATGISFEQILWFIAHRIEVYTESNHSDIYMDDLSDEDFFIKALEKIDFDLAGLGNALGALVNNFLIELLYADSNDDTAVRLVKTSMVCLPLPLNELVSQELFANCIVLLTRIDDPEFETRVLDQFFPEKITKSRIPFNLACYYALKQQKKKMLEQMALALKLGHCPSRFRKDDDFDAVRNDLDFKALLKKTFLKFRYFRALAEETDFEPAREGETCMLCKEEVSYLYTVDGGLAIISGHIKKWDTVCLSCLKRWSYAFEHQVEGGYITKNGIITESEKYPYLKETPSYTKVLLPLEEQLLSMEDHKINGLKHTPPFRAWQGAVWLTCCNDFMTFIGTWHHEDFVEHAPDGDAKKLFNKICNDAGALIYDGDKTGDRFYDEEFGPDCSEYAQSTFYAFECQHCHKLRGYVDNA